MGQVSDRFLHPGTKRVKAMAVTAVNDSDFPTEQIFYYDFAKTQKAYKWVLSYDNGSTTDNPDVSVYLWDDSTEAWETD